MKEKVALLVLAALAVATTLVFALRSPPASHGPEGSGSNGSPGVSMTTGSGAPARGANPPPAPAADGSAVVTTASISVLDDLVEQLAARAAEVGPVERRGGGLSLLGGTAMLTAGEIPEDNVSHFHLVLVPAASPTARLDACIIGMAPVAGQREDIAGAYLTLAFAPILSQLKETELLGAAGFHGAEPWGIAGRRGFVGPAGMRGPANPAFEEGVLFGDLPPLPDDGAPHLLKVVIYNDKGVWRRSLELDGAPPFEVERPWTGAPPQTDPLVVVRFAVFRDKDNVADTRARTAALAALDAHPKWLSEERACPADVLPASLLQAGYRPGRCEGGRLATCLSECERGSAGSCHSAADELEANGKNDATTEALFLRACRFGYPSACTNAAAHRRRDVKDKPMDECAFRTFGVVCDRAEDPWACTMLGAELVDGSKSHRDLQRARRVLARSCRYGAEDPACLSAKELLARIDGKR